MFQFAVLAFFLGLKHSFDADHLIAVSNLLSRAKSVRNSVKMSISWAAGHLLTATAITVMLFVFKDELLPLILDKMEILVALMLISIGLLGILNSRVWHSHEHTHDDETHPHWHIHIAGQSPGLQNHPKTDHSHKHMFGIGIVHGLASNDELLMLLTVSLGLSSLLEMVFGVFVFSVGVVVGMVAFGLLFTYPLIKMESARISQFVNLAVGTVSVVYGAILLAGFF